MSRDKYGVKKNLRNFVKVSIIVLIGLILSKIFAYLFRIIIAKTYGPEIYGVYTLALTIAAWFSTIFALGLAEGVLKFAPYYIGKKQLNKSGFIIKRAVEISLLMGIVSGIVMFLSADFVAERLFQSKELAIYLKAFSILMPASLLGNVLLSSLRAFEKISWYSFIFNIFQNVVKLGLLAILIWIGLKNSAIIVSQIVTTFAVMFLAYFAAGKIMKMAMKSEVEKNERELIFKSLFAYSWPIVFYSIISTIFYSIDSFLIGYFIDVTAVGLYNTATPIALLLAFAPELFMQIFFPVINKHYATKKLNLISELSKQVTKWTLIINMPLLVLMIIFPGSFINLLFGSEYLAATNSLRILAIGAFFSSISIVSYNLIAMTGKSKLLLMNTILSSALNVILCSIFIPLWGITGAASATALSFIFLSALLFFETKKNLKMIPYRRKSIRIAFSAIVPALIVMYFRDYARESLVTLAIAGIAYGLIYIGLIFLTQSLDSHDWDIIKAFKKKIESYTR